MPIDATGLGQLADDLEHAPVTVLADLVRAAEVWARHVRDDWRTLDSGLRHAPHYPRAITYDVSFGPSWAEAVVGPDKTRPQGALGNLIEYGSPTGNPPRSSGARALALNARDLERGVAMALGKAL